MPQFGAERLSARWPGDRPRLILLGAALILVMNLAGAGLAHGRQRHKPGRKQSSKLAACLPPNVKVGEIAVYGRPRNTTIAEKLKTVRARCRKGRLVGPDNKEIRFFRVACWGFPPPDYEEIQAEQNRKLEELKAKYTVIVIGCDPRLP